MFVAEGKLKGVQPMNPDCKSILEEKDTVKLDRMVAEEIFGFQVKEKQNYVQVTGKNAKEAGCPLCYTRKPGFWFPNHLKRYTHHMIYAMKAAEKTGLFDEYSLYQREDGTWCVGGYDEKTRRFVDIVTGDYPAEVVTRAALIYHRQPKSKKKVLRKNEDIPKESPLPDPVLMMIREVGARSGCWEGTTEGGKEVRIQDAISHLLYSIDGVTRKIPLISEERSKGKFLSLRYILRKLELYADPRAKFYRACTRCGADVQVRSFRKMEGKKEIYCPPCADRVQSVSREIKTLYKTYASEWTGTLADGSAFEVIWNDPAKELSVYVDGKRILWRDFYDDKCRKFDEFFQTDWVLRYIDFQPAADAEFHYRCLICKEKIPVSSIREMDESRNLCSCTKKRSEGQGGRDEGKGADLGKELFLNEKEMEKAIQRMMIRLGIVPPDEGEGDEDEDEDDDLFPGDTSFFILFDPKSRTFYKPRVYYRDWTVVKYSVKRPDLVKIHFSEEENFQYRVTAESIPTAKSLQRYQYGCGTGIMKARFERYDSYEPFELTEEEWRKLREAEIRRALKRLRSLGIPDRLEFFRLYDTEKREFFHDRRIYPSAEEAMEVIAERRLTDPCLRCVRFVIEITEEGDLECRCSLMERE